MALQAALAALKLRSRFNSPDDPVFANQAGKPISDNNVVKRVFAKGIIYVSIVDKRSVLMYH